jgi:serine/threonine protein kinase
MEKIADFEVVRELGRGGMGIVYEAIEEPLGRRVALKLLHPEWAAQEDSFARFVEEARKIARLSHPSIVKIHRFGQARDSYYLALEYVEGSPLDSVLAHKRMSLPDTVAVLKTIAEALGHAHEAGIIHRDIKPGNIFLRSDSSVVLGDFGIAKDLNPASHGITRTGNIIGTPAYMSPEQAQSHPLSPATDVYALGVLAFEMVAGRVPFTADTAISLLMKHVTEPPPPIVDLVSGVPRSLMDLIERMLEKSPARRPQNGKEVARLFGQIQKELSAAEERTQVISSEDRQGDETASTLDELEITVVCFDLTDFTRDSCQNLLPARVAFLLESWYRLARQAVTESGGVVDRYVGDRVTAIFGYPNRHTDHVRRAWYASNILNKSLSSFNRAHDLQLEMRAGIACGPALVGHIAGDVASTSVQGPLLGDMVALARTRKIEPPIRLNRAAYRRAASLAEFTRFEDSRVGEAWGAYPVDTPGPPPGHTTVV